MIGTQQLDQGTMSPPAADYTLVGFRVHRTCDGCKTSVCSTKPQAVAIVQGSLSKQSYLRGVHISGVV